MSNRVKLSAKELIAGGKLPEIVVPVCMRGDLQVAFEAAERELADAERRATDSLAGSGMPAIAARIEQLREEMLDHTLDVRLRALPRPEWKALVAAHQPRKNADGDVEEADKYIGVDVSTFFAAMIRACVVEPELDEDDWRLLLEERLTDRQFDNLSDAAWGLNRRDVDVPFSHAASRLTASSADA